MAAADVQLVCFDLGGVLVRICRHWRQACQLIGLPVDEAEAGLAVWRRRQDLLEDYEVGVCDEAQFFRNAGEALPMIGPENLRRIYEAWLLGMYEGAGQLIGHLARRGMVTACLSNTNPTHWRQLDRSHGAYAPLQELTYRWASHLLGRRKPDPGPFEFVERRLDLPGEAIVYFDDNADNIATATARRWQATLVDPTDPIPQITAVLREHGILRG